MTGKSLEINVQEIVTAVLCKYGVPTLPLRHHIPIPAISLYVNVLLASNSNLIDWFFKGRSHSGPPEALPISSM